MISTQTTWIKSMTYFIILLLCFSNVYSQQVVTGRVIDAQGNGISSASLTLIAERSVAQTDRNGFFEFILNQKQDTLNILALGYLPKKVFLNQNSSNLEIILSLNAQELQEVIVNTGYQQALANELVGSIETITKEQLQHQVSGNILDRLAGQVSGLTFSKGKSNGNPQNKTNIMIRGLSTINGPLDPLIVLDGFIYEGDIDNINPEEIESVSILKDATAASIWGARAGNGVIVITSKKGRYGQALRASFYATVSLGVKPDLFKVPQMSAADYIAVEQQLFNGGYFDIHINNRPHEALTPAVAIFLQSRSGLISKADSLNLIHQLKQQDSRDAYSNHFYTSSLTEQYGFNLSGGNTNHAYLFSTGYLNERGNLYEDRSRIDVRMNDEFRPFSKLKFSTGLQLTSSKNSSGRPYYGSLSILGRKPSYLSFTDADGNEIPLEINFAKDYTDQLGGGKLLDWNYYPLQDYQHQYSSSKQQEIYARTAVSYALFPFLNAAVQYQYQEQKSETNRIADEQSYYARNLINSFSQVGPQTNLIKYIVPVGGVLDLGANNISSYTLRGQLDFQHAWKSQEIQGIIGLEQRQNKAEGSSQTLYGYQADPLSYQQIDPINFYPNLVTGGSSTLGSKSQLSSRLNRFLSFYGNISYNFHKRYTFYGSIRKDGSNIFGANTNDRWKPLWSAGTSWELSNEEFYQVKVIPYLKLSATIGFSGNVDLTRTALPVASYSVNGLNGYRQARIDQINNPGLSWEKSRQLNFRIDFRTTKSRVSGSVEYYVKKGTDLYGSTPYDYTTWGFSNSITKNVADMKGNGFEVNLRSVNSLSRLKWTTQLLWSSNHNKTSKYYNETYGGTYQPIVNLLGGGTSINPIEGYPLYAVVAYRWGGLSGSGDPQGYIDNRKVTDYNAIIQHASKVGLDGGSLVFKGSAIPVNYGSLINSFNYQGFHLDVNIGYKFGYYIFKPSRSYQNLIENGVGYADYANRWQKPGDELITTVPSFAFPLNNLRDRFFSSSEANVISGDHIRLQYLNLGYSFFRKGKQKYFENLVISFNASNLGLIWRANQSGIDPDDLTYLNQNPVYSIGLKTNLK